MNEVVTWSDQKMAIAEDVANLATGVALIGTSSILFFLSVKMQKVLIPALKRGIRIIQGSSIILGSFLLLHGLYHLSEYFGNDFLSDDILEPVSILFLASFAVYVWKFLFVPSPKKQTQLQSKVSPSSPLTAPRQMLFLPLIVLPASIAAFAGNPFETFTLAGILFSTALFVWMVVKNPSAKSLHFQFASITIVWAVAEVPHVLNSIGIISVAGIEGLAVWIHFLSMLLIGVFVCVRSVTLVYPKQMATRVKIPQLAKTAPGKT